MPPPEMKRSGPAGAFFIAARMALAIAVAACCHAAQHTPLARIDLIRSLEATALAERPPVFVTGVVTFHEPETGLTFVQDGTAGIAIAAGEPSRLPASLRVGSRIEIEGVAAPGKFAPVLTGEDGAAPRVRVLGMAPMPAPLVLGAEELALGVHDGRLIELRGIVRSLDVKAYDPRQGEFIDGSHTETAPTAATRLSFELGTVAGRFTVIVPWKEDLPVPEGLLESRVRLRTVLGSIVNRRNQWVGVLLYLSSLDGLVVDRPPVVDPFTLPLLGTDQIQRFRATRPDEERVRVQGTVTLVQPRYRFFLAGKEGALEVQSRLPQPTLKLGSRVDVVGYPTLLGARVVLQNSVFRILGEEPPHQPQDTARTEALDRYLDGALIRLRGQLTQATLRGTARVLLVETEGSLLEVGFARLFTDTDLERLQRLKPGAELLITGIAQIASAAEWSGGARPYALSLLARDMDDIVVTRQPPWWTVGRLLGLVGLLLAMIVLGLVWVYLLQRRVERQTSIIRKNLEREAVWEERSRIARDIHDDVGAALTQISLLGELGRREGLAPEETLRQLKKIAGKAREAVRSLDEIVWTVNPRNDTVTRASSYLCQAAQDLLGGTPLRCRLHVPDELPEDGLGARVRHHLYLALRECINNVIKHAGASEVHLTLDARDGSFTLSVSDDGRGFDVGSADPLRSGLGNLRLRLEEVGGSCSIRSAPGQGTTVTLTVPTAGSSTSNAG